MASADDQDDFETLDDLMNDFWGRNEANDRRGTGNDDEVPTVTDDFDDNIREENGGEEIGPNDQRVQTIIQQEIQQDDNEHEEAPENLDIENIRQKRGMGCGCKKNCYDQFSVNVIYDHILNVCEMPKDQRDVYVMGVIGIKHLERTHTRRGERKQFHCKFQFKDAVICREAFKVCYAVGEVMLRNIINHMKVNGITPRRHGNTKRKPHNAFNFTDVQRIVNFLNNYAEENGMPFPAPLRGRDGIPPIYLHSSETKKNIHKVYEASCVENDERAAKYRSFIGLWNSCCPHIRVSQPEEDACGKCEKLRKQFKDARSEDDKLAAANAMQEHILSVRKEKEVYRQCISRSREELSNTEVPVLQVPPRTSEYSHVHVTFDFSQGVSIPHFAKQIGALYFLTPRKIQIFGVRFDGFPVQLNYLIDEDETIGQDGKNVHGPNTVISLLDDALSKYSIGEKVLKLHSDNCAGQNKNMYVMAYLAWRILAGLNDEIQLMMQIAGHARCLIDAGFAHIKRMYRRCDVETLGHLEDVVARSAFSNRPVMYKNHDGTRNWEWRDWKSFLSRSFRSLRGISSHQHFRFSSISPGTVFLKKFADGEESSYCLIKGDVTDVSLNRPDPIQPAGLSAVRQQYLYRSIRPYVRPVNQDVTCPAPFEE